MLSSNLPVNGLPPQVPIDFRSCALTGQEKTRTLLSMRHGAVPRRAWMFHSSEVSSASVACQSKLLAAWLIRLVGNTDTRRLRVAKTRRSFPGCLDFTAFLILGTSLKVVLNWKTSLSPANSNVRQYSITWWRGCICQAIDSYYLTAVGSRDFFYFLAESTQTAASVVVW